MRAHCINVRNAGGSGGPGSIWTSNPTGQNSLSFDVSDMADVSNLSVYEVRQLREALDAFLSEFGEPPSVS